MYILRLAHVCRRWLFGAVVRDGFRYCTADFKTNPSSFSPRMFLLGIPNTRLECGSIKILETWLNMKMSPMGNGPFVVGSLVRAPQPPQLEGFSSRVSRTTTDWKKRREQQQPTESGCVRWWWQHRRMPDPATADAATTAPGSGALNG